MSYSLVCYGIVVVVFCGGCFVGRFFGFSCCSSSHGRVLQPPFRPRDPLVDDWPGTGTASYQMEQPYTSLPTPLLTI